MSVAAPARAVLNRIVFNGIESYSPLFAVPADRVRGADMPRRHATATATVPLDRLGTELAQAGFSRSARTPTADTWGTGDGATLTIHASAAEASDMEDTMVREYAILLTNVAATADGASVRVTVPAALPAVWWWRHRARAVPVEDSPEIEDIIELVVRHPNLVKEVRQLPDELRRVVSAVAQRIASDDGCTWAVARALPDARHAPNIVNGVVDRFLELAQ